MITGLDDSHKIAIGDQLKLECGAIIYNYTNTINWTKGGEIIDSSNRIKIEETNTQYSWRKTLIFDRILKENSGEYHCEVYDKTTNEIQIAIGIIEVHDAHPPSIIPNFNQSSISLPFGGMLNIECYVSGLPLPNIKW